MFRLGIAQHLFVPCCENLGPRIFCTIWYISGVGRCFSIGGRGLKFFKDTVLEDKNKGAPSEIGGWEWAPPPPPPPPHSYTTVHDGNTLQCDFACFAY